MNPVEAILKYWPILMFILMVAFVLGGYAVMIGILREQVKALFAKSSSRDDQMRALDLERAVLQNELKNMKELITDVKGLLSSLASEIRGDGHTRKGDV